MRIVSEAGTIDLCILRLPIPQKYIRRRKIAKNRADSAGYRRAAAPEPPTALARETAISLPAARAGMTVRIRSIFQPCKD
jgi:hypothetical protein